MKEVFFLESNLTGYGTIALQLAKAQGYMTHFLTHRPEEYTSLKPNPVELADKMSIVDTYDIAKLLHFFIDKQPAALVAFDDYRLIQAALIAQHLGLPHANVDGLVNVRFKDRTRTKIQGIGLPVRFAIRPVQEPGFTSPIGYPCVVKPIDDSGSTGVRICYNDRDYVAAFSHIRERFINLRGYRLATFALVEEFIDGPEYTAEMIWDRQHERWHLLGFTKKLMADPPYRVEIGAMFPYIFEDDLAHHIEAVVCAWLKAVGHSYGAAHIEFKVVNGQPALMEINPRLGGDQIRDLILYTRDIDSINLYLHLYLGLARAIEPDLSQQAFATSFYLLPPKAGKVLKVLPPEESMPGVIRSKLVEGEINIASITDNDDRLGYVLTKAHEFDLSLYYAQNFMKHVNVEYAPEE